MFRLPTAVFLLSLIAAVLMTHSGWALGQPHLNNSATSPLPPVPSDITTVIDYDYRVITTHPHDAKLFTQGLAFNNGILFESSGQYGHSQLLTRSLSNIKATTQHVLKRRYFGEGLTVLNNKIYQLTWRAQRGFIYDRHTLQPTGHFRYRGEGWGLCNNGQSLIMSNGSALLQFINPNTFKLEHSVKVTLNGRPAYKLNELEWVDGFIYANIWQSDWIIIIDPVTGHVVGRVELTQLLSPKQQKHTNVLNGIAYDSQQKRLLVTGKYWPTLFEIELISQ